GADVIHMIYLDPDPRNIPLAQIQSTFDTMDRMMTIQFAININEDVETVNWINQGLALIERVARGDATLSDDDMRNFVRVASQVAQRLQTGAPYKKVTIHRYRPREDLGGVMGFLNFTRPRIAELIEAGYQFALSYDPATDSIIPA